MTIAIYPGSFDPPTNGHIDLIMRASRMFENVIVAILHNPNKVPLFKVEERVAFLEELTREHANIKIEMFHGLLVDFVKMKHANVVVRGVREYGDFEVELKMANMNHYLHEEMDTIFLPTRPEHAFVSSSLVKDVVEHGGDAEGLVPTAVLRALRARYLKSTN